MRYITCIVIILMSSFFLFSGLCAAAGGLDDLIDEARIILEESADAPEGIPLNLLKKSTAIAIFPSTIKGAFFLGARYGKGVVLRRDPDTAEWSPPAFFKIKGVSFGWQIGGQAIDLIFVIPTERGFMGMLDNKLNVGTNTALVVGPVGRNAELGADIKAKGGIFTYSRSKGLFAGVGLKGLSITPDEAANEKYYGVGATARGILTGGKAIPAGKAKALARTLKKLTK